MASPPQADRAVESLLAFWAEAGVDAMLSDAAVDRVEAGRIRPPAPAPAAARPAATPRQPAPAARRGEPAPEGAVAQARAMAAEANDLAALAAAIAAFEGCPLRYEGARQAVFSRGPADAPLMIVGEGPGADEDAQGQPFVGRAGQMLDRILGAAGLKDRAFITNTVFWRPPGNRTPTPAEQAVCAPFVERAVALVKPKVLLLAGGASAKAMLKREEGILTLRGRWFEWRSEDGEIALPAMPTLHPAFLLRQPAAKKRAWSDVLTVAERVDRPDRSD